MLQTGREYPSLCPSLPSDFYPVGSDFVRFDLQLLFISQNCLHHNNQTHVSCCVTYTCCHHSLWHRWMLWLFDLFADTCYFIFPPPSLSLLAFLFSFSALRSVSPPFPLSLLVSLIKHCDSVLWSDVNSMANYFLWCINVPNSSVFTNSSRPMPGISQLK